jgi:hypothetical protein
MISLDMILLGMASSEGHRSAGNDLVLLAVYWPCDDGAF